MNKMTKRIKITDPKDLREGMRVEVVWGDGGVETGKLFKRDCMPSRPSFGLDLGDGENSSSLYPSMITNPVDGDGDTVKSIHRLIDGIEDVVVGDILEDDGDEYVKVIDQASCIYFLSGRSDSLEDMQDPPQEMGHEYTMSKHDLINTFYIYIPEEELPKIELTETEAKEIIAEVKGEKIENIIIKKDE